MVENIHSAFSVASCYVSINIKFYLFSDNPLTQE